jgi:hypothetical protein
MHRSIAPHVKTGSEVIDANGISAISNDCSGNETLLELSCRIPDQVEYRLDPASIAFWSPTSAGMTKLRYYLAGVIILFRNDGKVKDREG